MNHNSVISIESFSDQLIEGTAAHGSLWMYRMNSTRCQLMFYELSGLISVLYTDSILFILSYRHYTGGMKVNESQHHQLKIQSILIPNM